MSLVLDNHMMEGKFLGGPPGVPCHRKQMVIMTALHENNKNGSGSKPCSPSSSSSSSIGVNSDDDDDDDEIDNGNADDDEIESKLMVNKSPYDSAVAALEQALPLRRGISNFYNGKSKSFASLADAASSSIKDITKTENAYSRKRKNLLSYSLYNQGRTAMIKSPGIVSAVAKGSPCSILRTVDDSEDGIVENDSIVEVDGKIKSRNPSLSRALPPIPPPWRSFSHADLQHCGVSVGALNSSLMGKRTKRDEVL